MCCDIPTCALAWASEWQKADPLGPLGSSSSQQRRTLELILQEGSAFFSASNPRSERTGHLTRGRSLSRRALAGAPQRVELGGDARGTAPRRGGARGLLRDRRPFDRGRAASARPYARVAQDNQPQFPLNTGTGRRARRRDREVHAGFAQLLRALPSSFALSCPLALPPSLSLAFPLLYLSLPPPRSLSFSPHPGTGFRL